MWNLAVGHLYAQPMLQLSPLCLFSGYFNTFFSNLEEVLQLQLYLWHLVLRHLGVFSSKPRHCPSHGVHAMAKALLSRPLRTLQGHFPSG